MASISTDKKTGLRKIQFVNKDGDRKTVRVGHMALKSAQTMRTRIEALNAADILGEPIDKATAEWLRDLGKPMRDKLARVGLALGRQRMQLGPFLRDYRKTRKDVKPATKEIWQHTIDNLEDCLGVGKWLDTITEGHAENFKQYLIGDGLAMVTVQKRLQFARQFFKAAKKRRLIQDNPFAEVSAAAGSSKAKQFYVTTDTTEALLEAANPTWKVIISLCRYGGLRCPSEVLSLKWDDILWDANRMWVPSPKTERHEGMEARLIPLFHELLPILLAASEAAPDGAVYVVGGSYRDFCNGPKGWRNINLRTELGRIIKRAGLKQWPRPFHNLRASRQTELTRDFPAHVVCRWLGNSPRVALRHYLQVADSDYEKAAQKAAHEVAPIKNV